MTVNDRWAAYAAREKAEALWSVDRAIRRIRMADTSGVNPEVIEDILDALERAERALLGEV